MSIKITTRPKNRAFAPVQIGQWSSTSGCSIENGKSPSPRNLHDGNYATAGKIWDLEGDGGERERLFELGDYCIGEEEEVRLGVGWGEEVRGGER